MTANRRLHAALGFVVAGALVLGVALPVQSAIRSKLASRSSNGTPANGHSYTGLGGGALSGDGSLVAFHSNAANLPGGDGLTYRAYVRDFDRGRTTLVSKDNDGDPAEGDVSTGAISANGRFVVFHGHGDGLPGADGSTSQVWIHDRRTGRTRLVSRASNGDPADRDSYQSSVSATGRSVAFSTSADNLPGGDGTTTRVYVRDLERGKTVLASKTNGGQPAYGLVYGQALSSTGRFVAFESFDDGLPGGDGNLYHIYLRDLERRRTILIDRNRDGQVADDNSYYPSVSGKGRFVAFESDAGNLPGGDGTNRQIYLRDVERGRTTLVSRGNAGDPQDGSAEYGQVSGNGRYVVFAAAATNLPGGPTGQIYGRDIRERKTRLLSRASNGDPADEYVHSPAVSEDGRWTAFYTGADNLGGNTSYSNVFRAGPIG